MDYKLLNAPSCFSEISRMESEREDGIVVNVAERLWASCALDNAFREDVRKANNILIFHSNYRHGMVDLVFPGDLSICIIERENNRQGVKIFERAQNYFQKSRIPAAANGSDFFMLHDRLTVHKVGSYGVVHTKSGMWETTIHFSIHSDMNLLKSFKLEPPEMIRGGLEQYGVTAEKLLKEVMK